MHEAEFNLGLMAHYGRGTNKDYVQAMNHYMKASAKSIPEADLNIAFLHHYGLGTSVNLDKSFEYFTKAAKHNFPQAQYHLGLHL